MAVTPEDLSNKSDEEILKSMHGAVYDSDHYKHCFTTLQLRYTERTVKATSRLVVATWTLVIATLLLLLGALL